MRYVPKTYFEEKALSVLRDNTTVKIENETFFENFFFLDGRKSKGIIIFKGVTNDLKVTCLITFLLLY